MRLVPVKCLKENSKIALNVIDSHGRLMVHAGHAIAESGIKILNRLGVNYVYISDEYCFNSNQNHQFKAPESMHAHVMALREIGHKIAEGESGAKDITTATEVATKIVEDMLLLPDDLKISYEPTKIIANSIIEQSIYVAMMSTALGVKMNLDKKQLVKLCLCTLLKDVALLSPKISSGGVIAYQQHPQVAYTYLKQTYNLDEEILQGILHHHEYFDGSGYPNKLKGTEICTFARIISLVDSFYELKSNHDSFSSTELLFEAKLKKILLKFDAEMITYFIKNAEIFNLDTLIRLTNDDLAVIYQNNPMNPFKPVIKIIRSNVYEEGSIINLHETNLSIKSIEYYVD